MQQALFAPWRRVFRVMAAVLCSALLTGCASFYVDTSTPDVPPSEFKKPGTPRPVQLLFQFQTKGTVNEIATKQLKDRVADHVRASGLFASVSDQPAEGGALLSVTLNNVPLTDNAFTKGFVTGLTFGLAGSTVSDGYVCTVSYSAKPGQAALVKQARHAIHTGMGAGSAPSQAIKANSAEEAVNTMTRQVVSRALKELSDDNAFLNP